MISQKANDPYKMRQLSDLLHPKLLLCLRTSLLPDSSKMAALSFISALVIVSACTIEMAYSAPNYQDYLDAHSYINDNRNHYESTNNDHCHDQMQVKTECGIDISKSSLKSSASHQAGSSSTNSICSGVENSSMGGSGCNSGCNCGCK
uniref:Uncharacterized protein n=1 Tax=Graphocephala atropunctata TaxID=36148 RepID=A0A1B6LJS8_9HEMI